MLGRRSKAYGEAMNGSRNKLTAALGFPSRRNFIAIAYLRMSDIAPVGNSVNIIPAPQAKIISITLQTGARRLKLRLSACASIRGR